MSATVSMVSDPRQLADRVEKLTYEALFEDGPVRLGPISEQHYLAAIAALKQAEAAFRLADIYAMRKD